MRIDLLTFHLGMLSWLVYRASVHFPAAESVTWGLLQGRESYHHWRSPSRLSQTTTSKRSNTWRQQLLKHKSGLWAARWM